MGTKRGYLVLVGLMLLLLFSGCGEKAAPVEKGAGGLEDVLVAPLPTEGVKVAEIGGYDYVYDPLYLFQVEAADWSDMSAAQIKRCLLLELTAREAAETMAITLQETYEEQHGTGDEAGFLKYLDNHYNDLLEKYQVKQVY